MKKSKKLSPLEQALVNELRQVMCRYADLGPTKVAYLIDIAIRVHAETKPALPVNAMKFTELPADYAGLCRVWLPRPIRNQAQYELVDALFLAMEHKKLTKEQRDYFQVLDAVLEVYETALIVRRIKRIKGEQK